MSKLIRVIAIAIGLSAVASGATAALAATPSSVRATFSSGTDGTTIDMAVDDGSYYEVASEPTKGPHTAGYVATFSGINASGVTPEIEFTGRSVAEDCTMAIAAFNWKKQKWTLWLGYATVPEGTIDVAREGHADRLRPYVRRGKLKARVTCVAFAGPFGLNTDHLALTWQE